MMQLSAKALLKPFSGTTTDCDRDSEITFDGDDAPILENIGNDEEQDEQFEDEDKDDNEVTKTRTKM